MHWKLVLLICFTMFLGTSSLAMELFQQPPMATANPMADFLAPRDYPELHQRREHEHQLELQRRQQIWDEYQRQTAFQRTNSQRHSMTMQRDTLNGHSQGMSNGDALDKLANEIRSNR